MSETPRYDRQRRSNVKAAPAQMTPEFVGDVLGRANGFAPASDAEIEAIRDELKRSGGVPLLPSPHPIALPIEADQLADVPATIRGNLEWGLQPYQREFAGIPQGASGTARKAPSAVSSGTASRRSARAPHVSQAVVDNRSTGGEPHVVVVPSRRTGKTAPRDWIARRHEVLDAAIRYLKARCILVDVVDRSALVRRYRISGKHNPVYLEGVIALAESLGFEVSC